MGKTRKARPARIESSYSWAYQEVFYGSPSWASHSTWLVPNPVGDWDELGYPTPRGAPGAPR